MQSGLPTGPPPLTPGNLQPGASPGRKQWGGQKTRVGLMASAEREPITGVRERSPPEAESSLPLNHPNEGQNMPL